MQASHTSTKGRGFALALSVAGALGAAVFAVACLLVPLAAAAQAGENLEKPPNWRARYDDGTEGERGYVVMRPGWHVNPGPAGVLWDPGSSARGNYAVTSTIFLFPPGQGEPPSQVDAPYGLVLAGEHLGGENPSYVSFLLRNDGSFRVARHVGGETHELVGWTPHDAIAVWTQESEGTAKNVLGVDAGGEAVAFWVNDEQVASLPRSDLPMAGIVGLRAGEGLSLHITEIAIGPNRQ